MTRQPISFCAQAQRLEDQILELDRLQAIICTIPCNTLGLEKAAECIQILSAVRFNLRIEQLIIEQTSSAARELLQ